MLARKAHSVEFHKLSYDLCFVDLIIPHSQWAQYQSCWWIVLFAGESWSFWCFWRPWRIQIDIAEWTIHFQWSTIIDCMDFLLELRNGRLILLVCILQVQDFLSIDLEKEKISFFHTKMDIFPSRFSKHLHSSTVCSFPWGHRSVDDFAVGWRVLGTFPPFHSQIVRCTELCVPVHWPNENISNLVKYQQILQITNIWVSETSGLPCIWVRYFR